MKRFLLKILIIFSLFFQLKAETFLVFGGKTGWLGQQIVQLITNLGYKAVCAESRLENRQDIIEEIKKVKPDYIINAAGLTGKPNVDWCEDHRQETIRANVLGELNLADIAFLFNIHLTNLCTGCKYEYNDTHRMGSGIGFTEEDEPNFKGSFFVRSKILSEKLILEYPNVLNIRIKIPIASNLNPKGFIGKIIRYKKLVNIPNSVCLLDDLLPILIEMTLKRLKGNYNFANPGTISHNEIMDLYKKYIDPNHKYENFTLEEQNKILKSGRAHSEMNVSKLLKIFPNIPNIKDSIIKVFEKIKLSEQK